ncbi:MAG: hypothetical protein JOZ99_13665 [Actinobacteria bacterium]|nr:hypothetical protein [Actinomycetota bacterium]
MGVVAIVLLGVIGVVLAKNANDSSTGLKIGDHWHAALGVNVCGNWLPSPPETPRDSNGLIVRHGTDTYAGIHTHGDGLIHFEPEASDDTGSHATVGRYFNYNGWSLSQTSFAYDQGAKESNGNTCPAANGQPAAKGTLTWAVNGKEKTGNLAGYAPRNGDRIVLAFEPAGKNAASLGDPPSTAALQQALNSSAPNSGVSQTSPLTSSTPSTAAPGATPTTAPAGAPASTTPTS